MINRQAFSADVVLLRTVRRALLLKWRQSCLGSFDARNLSRSAAGPFAMC